MKNIEDHFQNLKYFGESSQDKLFAYYLSIYSLTVSHLRWFKNLEYDVKGLSLNQP